MKKIIVIIVSFIVCCSMLLGCSQNVVTPPDSNKEHPSYTESPNSPDFDIENTEATEPILVFGEQTYNDSVQINQKDLGWATYDSIPNEIVLGNHIIFPCNDICQMPNWETELIDNVAISKKDNNLILMSIVAMNDNPQRGLLCDEALDLLETKYNIITTQTAVERIPKEDAYWTVTKGIANEDLRYVMYMHSDGLRGISFFGIWDVNDIYTEESMHSIFESILATVNQYPDPTEE